MQLKEAVQHMSTHYLRRVLDSYRDESRKPEEDEARQRLIRDADSLADPQNVAARLNLSAQTFNDQILYSFIAEALLEDDDYLLPEDTIIASKGHPLRLVGSNILGEKAKAKVGGFPLSLS